MCVFVFQLFLNNNNPEIIFLKSNVLTLANSDVSTNFVYGYPNLLKKKTT